jgi:hypothetical protein
MDCLTNSDIIIKLFTDILTSDYYNHTFYAHNLAKFDGILILEALYRKDEFDMKIIMKDNNDIILLIVTKYFKDSDGKVINRSVKILDSNLILPNSLRKLAIEFNCDILKGHFPHKFISDDNLKYVGELPDIKYFEDISSEDYNNLVNEFINKKYSIQEESDKYLKADLISLIQILEKFSSIIFKDFSLNITKFKTISALALNIYTTNYYKNNFMAYFFCCYFCY